LLGFLNPKIIRPTSQLTSAIGHIPNFETNPKVSNSTIGCRIDHCFVGYKHDSSNRVSNPAISFKFNFNRFMVLLQGRNSGEKIRAQRY
jgi:hypothetical protein